MSSALYDKVSYILRVVQAPAQMTSVKEQLRLIRLDPAAHHDAQRVLALSKPLIESGKVSSFGNDAWDVYEQAAIAALEVSDDELAVLCISRLSDKFPASGRVHALKGMLYECTRDPEETLKYYNKVLSVEPTNVVCHFTGRRC